MLEHFRFLKNQCDTAHVTAKMTIPSPAVLHFRGGRKAISKAVYPDLDAFFDDLGKTYRKAVQAFYDAGCRYLQFDERSGPISARRTNCRMRATAATIPKTCRKSTPA